mgnify:CR=1 FL=1
MLAQAADGPRGALFALPALRVGKQLGIPVVYDLRGADVAIDYRKADVGRKVRELTGKRGVDVVVDGLAVGHVVRDVDAVAIRDSLAERHVERDAHLIADALAAVEGLGVGALEGLYRHA